MQNNFLVVDVETGGLDPSTHSIMSIAGVKWAPDKDQLLFSFLIKEEKLEFTWAAMNVNKLTVADICNLGVTPKDAVKDIRIALDAAYGADREPVIMVGHNIHFDELFVRRLYWLAGEDYMIDFSHRSLDTASILLYKMLRGEIPTQYPNSNFLFELTGIDLLEEERHTAHHDCLATAVALRRLVNDHYKIPKEKIEA
jgi:DNA polymerase III epsilon subunit-like protein